LQKLPYLQEAIYFLAEMTVTPTRVYFSLSSLLSLSFFFPQTYKENVLEVMLQGTEKMPPLITDYKEYHTDTTVKFIIKMTAEKLQEAEAAGLHKVFKLQTSLTCHSMVCIISFIFLLFTFL